METYLNCCTHPSLRREQVVKVFVFQENSAVTYTWYNFIMFCFCSYQRMFFTEWQKCHCCRILYNLCRTVILASRMIVAGTMPKVRLGLPELGSPCLVQGWQNPVCVILRNWASLNLKSTGFIGVFEQNDLGLCHIYEAHRTVRLRPHDRVHVCS